MPRPTLARLPNLDMPKLARPKCLNECEARGGKLEILVRPGVVGSDLRLGIIAAVSNVLRDTC